MSACADSLGAPASLPANADQAKDAAKDGGAPGGGVRSKPVRGTSLTPSFIPASRETSRVMTSAPPPEPHLGWFSRGYLPHWDQPGMIQSLTFRLHDSLPREVVEKWKLELGLPPGGHLGAPSRERRHPCRRGEREVPDPREAELRKRIVRYEDQGHGACWLRDPRIGRLVEQALLHFDGRRYRLLAWCIMPNHVHVMIEANAGFPVPEVLHSWKSYTASEANKLLGRRGEFWQREYHDRYIRHAEHYVAAIRYIEGNPVNAGLVMRPADWPFSSARCKSPGAPPGAPASLPASEKKDAAKDGGAPRSGTPEIGGSP